MVYRNCGMCHVEPLNRCSDCPGRRTVADTVREVAVPAAFDQRRVDRLNHRDFYEAYMGRPVPPSTLSTAKRLEKIWVEIHCFGRPSADNSFWMFERLKAQEDELGRSNAALSNLLNLVLNNTSPDAFSNGVTDSTGTIDEGQVIAAGIIEEARRHLLSL